MENNTKYNNNHHNEEIRHLRGYEVLILALAGIAGLLFLHWIGRLLWTALLAIIESAPRHFAEVFTFGEVMVITVAVSICAIAYYVANSKYLRQNKRKCRWHQQNSVANRRPSERQDRTVQRQPRPTRPVNSNQRIIPFEDVAE